MNRRCRRALIEEGLGLEFFKYKENPIRCNGYPWYDSLFMKPHIEIECDPYLWNRVESLIRSRLSMPAPSGFAQRSIPWLSFVHSLSPCRQPEGPTASGRGRDAPNQFNMQAGLRWGRACFSNSVVVKPLANIGTKFAKFIDEEAQCQVRTTAAQGVSDSGVGRGVPGVGDKCGAKIPYDRGEGKSFAAPIDRGYKGANEGVTGAWPSPVQVRGGVPRIFMVGGGKPRPESV